MLTFYQYLETITHDKFDPINDDSKESYLKSILNRLNHKTIVRFALFCVKDAQQFSNDPSISNVINLIEKWLKTNTSVNAQEVRTATVDAAHHAAADDDFVDYYAVNAANTASHTIDATDNTAAADASGTAAANVADAAGNAAAAVAAYDAYDYDVAYDAEYNATIMMLIVLLMPPMLLNIMLKWTFTFKSLNH